MKQVPVKASGFKTMPEEIQAIALANGIVPVNDIFYDYWNNKSRIFLLYGGYGSGKSVFFVDRLIDKALNNPYFRCFFGRKIFDTVRTSIFLTITDRIEERGLQHLFSYSKADNSKMIIKVKAKGNNNSFTPFGADNAEKLKGVKDPTDIFCDELDQFSEKDFGILVSRLRTEKAEKQLCGAFNTTTVPPGHWLKTTLFDDETSVKYARYQRMGITKVFCNYTDNYFIDQKDYEETLWIAAAFNETKFREISKGEWGSDVKDNTFIYAFRSKARKDRRPGYSHIVDGMVPDYKLKIIASFDFNVEPITCSIWQHAPDLSWISGLQEYRLMNSDIFELCQRIRTDHPEAFFMITGDATGRSRTAITRGNKNYFYFIKRELRVSDRQFVLPGKNPFHANTRVLANVLFAKHPALLLNRSMNHLLNDISSVLCNEDGGIEKGKDKYKGHLLDTMLYYFWNFHLSFLKRYKTSLPEDIQKAIDEVLPAAA